MSVYLLISKELLHSEIWTSNPTSGAIDTRSTGRRRVRFNAHHTARSISAERVRVGARRSRVNVLMFERFIIEVFNKTK